MQIEDQIKWMETLRDTLGLIGLDSGNADQVLQTLRSVQTKKPTLLWHYDTPTKRGVYPVKCDGPNPNAGFRYWTGERWGSWSQTHKGALTLGRDSRIRKAQIKRPVMYATKSKS